MANSIRVEVVSAEKALYSGEAAMVFAPASEGEVGIAPKHAPMVSTLAAGVVRVQPADGGPEEPLYVSGGLLEVQPHVVTILSDVGERAADLDEAAVVAAKEAAEKALADRSSEMDEARARAELAQTVAQLKALRHLRGR